jgi:hypothetical protein
VFVRHEIGGTLRWIRSSIHFNLKEAARMCYQNEIKYIKSVLGADSTTGFLSTCAYIVVGNRQTAAFSILI